MNRFEYRKGSQSIIDNLTGWSYSGDDKTCRLLNEQSERADRNAELLNIDCVAQYKFCKDVRRIMRKYEINSLEKLDMVLREQRLW